MSVSLDAMTTLVIRSFRQASRTLYELSQVVHQLWLRLTASDEELTSLC